MRLSSTIGLTLPLVLALSALTPVLGERTAQQIVQDANRLLSEGSYMDAARAYGEAIELDPTSYVNYYKRATVYLSLGRHSAALEDFDAILRLNPGFTQAHLQKAKILAKEGRFEDAQGELKTYTKSKTDDEASELARSVQSAVTASTSAKASAKKQQWQACVDAATRALEVGPNAVSLRELRVDCATHLGDVEATYGDLTRLATLSPSLISLPLQLSHIAYFILGSPTALSHIKQCLHYDPDSKPCKKVHKLLRSLDKETTKARNFVEGGAWRQAIKILDGEDGLLAKFDRALEDAASEQDGVTFLATQFSPKTNSKSRLELYSLACKAAVGAGDFKKERGALWCDITLSLDPENIDGLVGQGEKLLKEEKWDEATRTLEKAFEKSGRSSQDIMGRLQKAQKLLKISKQKDYYKVLDVPRDADERTIKKAFRKKAKTAHPDVGGSEEKMAALNEAYEVLSNEDLRRRYDNGDDPNDPTGGHGGGGNPFAHHGGGMPFQFFQQGGGGGGGFPFPGGGGQKVHFQWN